jgi:undecaprenyl phosphate-alpha-L-ara4N flippase subunit ArnE
MKTTLGISGVILFCIAANVLLKIGASQPSEQRFIFGLIGWHALAGFVAWGLAALLYAWVLQWLPLNVAQSLLALQFVGIILASKVLLDEPIDPMRWLGIGLIFAGILVVGFASRQPG